MIVMKADSGSHFEKLLGELGTHEEKGEPEVV